MKRVAVLVDGENLSAARAGHIIMGAAHFGSLTIRRVYGNAARLPQWDAAPGFHLIHSGSGKNATDLLLTVEAMALIHDRLADMLVIASSDRDFSHLATHLRERGTEVVGMGEATASPVFRKACTKFIELKPPVAAPEVPPPPPKAPAKAPSFDEIVQAVVRAGPQAGLPLTTVNAAVQKECGFRIATTPDKTWRAYFTRNAAIFDCDPKGPTARVRLRKPGAIASPRSAP